MKINCSRIVNKGNRERMEEDIVYNALRNLEGARHIYAKFETSQNLDGDLIFDFPFNNEPLRMFFEVKKELRQHQIPQLLERKLAYENFLLVAGRLHPAIKNVCRKKE